MKKTIKHLKVLTLLILGLTSCTKESDFIDKAPNASNTSRSIQNSEKITGATITANAFRTPPKDGNGFTRLIPSSNSQFVYVNPRLGNDNTGEVYTKKSREVGTDPTQPKGKVKPFKTIAAATKKMRKDQPDWLLLASGGIFYESLKLNTVRGKSINERAVVTAYGSNKSRPQLRTGSKIGLSRITKNIIVSGLHFWAHTRDRDGAYYESSDDANGFGLSSNPKDFPIKNLIIEDCYFRSYTKNTILNLSSNPFSNIVIRRNIFSKNYSEKHVSVGLYASSRANTDTSFLLLEENTFDHSGWLIQSPSGNKFHIKDGAANMKNHSTYLVNLKGTVLKGNLFLRSASIGNKFSSVNNKFSSNIRIENNFYYHGEIGISMGGNQEGPLRFRNVTIRNNVMMHIGNSRPTNRTLAWGIHAKDWQNGIINNNLFLHSDNPKLNNVWALSINSSKNNGKTDGILVSRNIIYNYEGTSKKLGLISLRAKPNTLHNVSLEYNTIRSKKNSPLVSTRLVDGKLKGYSLYHNFYHSNLPEDKWFSNYKKSNGNIFDNYASFKDWKLNFDPKAKKSVVSRFPNPERNLAKYAAHIGVGSSDIAFIKAAYKQSKKNWNPALTAPKLNNWIRQGYNR